eukprot:3324636-Amphidinium_carterae.1
MDYWRPALEFVVAFRNERSMLAMCVLSKDSKLQRCERKHSRLLTAEKQRFTACPDLVDDFEDELSTIGLELNRENLTWIATDSLAARTALAQSTVPPFIQLLF